MNLLKQKPISAGWQSKKAAPWKPTHDLLQISLAGHVLDAFWLHCGHRNFDVWAANATMDDLSAVAKHVYRNLFTSRAVEEQINVEEPDTVLMNTILYNRDVLYYWLLVKSIKADDIGHVVLILWIWMVMMCTPKTMPRYANPIFETLGRLQQYPEEVQKLFLHNWLVNLTGRADGCKEVDLLQEYSNFWVKTVYGAKGVNCNWDWLSMISVCIYSLRDAMHVVQNTFGIPIYGTRHTTPDMSKEVQYIAKKLREEKVQEYVAECPANHDFHEGSKYANKRSAFSRYRVDEAIIADLGFCWRKQNDKEELYIPSTNDLAMDSEEPIDMADELLAGTMALFEDD
ncbi:hypothetical protein BDP27DRAFT_1430576 [Rhodocollybia butyracea]|uniref:DUF6589 domain-containing protein n=1 Tax=Rhodocollybia butyracea TaxID=206335 RepID=A0A9P5PDB7_9AGAR|nr:hypothetical protein BDP27DRAFT_1430576 [Rhodocollybia butyracea]